MKVCIVQLQRDSMATAERMCDLGVIHEVPGSPENIWAVVEADDLTVATNIAHKKYPSKDGWRVRFGTVNAVKIE